MDPGDALKVYTVRPGNGPGQCPFGGYGAPVEGLRVPLRLLQETRG
jgi:hypothetical protein